ncbi:globin [Roseivirga sp. BDSF3-8]|uniref:globin n=1 Tax=Roseivirga sp. BDSF3-8 TaxID=3241598 RepID=UPI0035319E7D
MEKQKDRMARVSEEAVKTAQESYGRCLANGNMLESFYDKFLSKSPLIKDRFKDTDFESQYKLLRHGINLMLMYAQGNIAGKSGLERIRYSHSREQMAIPPYSYDLWKAALLEVLPLHDRKYNAEVKAAWSEVMDFGIEHIRSGY